MNSGRRRKRGAAGGRSRLPPRHPGGADFESEPGRRRRGARDEVIESDDDSEEASGGGGGAEPEVEEEEVPETAAEKRLRIARGYVEKLRAVERKHREEEEEDEEGEEEEDEERRVGLRDSHVAELLQKDQLEASGRTRRLIASRVEKPGALDEFRIVRRHRQSVTAVALTEDDARGFSASKDGCIVQWDVESGKKEKYAWPGEDVLVSHSARAPQNRSSKRSKHVLALAVSSDGRYLATGGMDRHVHLWDTRTRKHVQAFHGHKGPVSCLTFRQGSPQLFSASFDRSVKLWNAEDRCHIDTLHGHESEVLTIDCLREERLLTVGRDRTVRLWKVSKESQLIFRAPTSLECGCFINNEEFLSGSDDGSIELWNVLWKKPRCIVKNAHSILVAHSGIHERENKKIPNGVKNEDDVCNGIDTNVKVNSCSTAQSWVSSVAVCRGSDLAASGAANGMVRLWAVENDTASIRPLYDFPLVGFVNSLAFAKSGRFLVAGVGQTNVELDNEQFNESSYQKYMVLLFHVSRQAYGDQQ
ncbi:hypothetical protein Taro_037272 [Colocasia esculenta]|uniref:Uncharacterized protein n=1 Tax=Colocasia esculenta TaxID=4460 RepID=A0A843WKB9_COLES|nr:hypothetical protein [Colocasia esculenta]